MASTLQVQIVPITQGAQIKLTGEARLDLEDAAFQLDRVVALRPQTVIVDMSELTFLSSIGMSLLVNLRRNAARTAGTVVLAGILPRIREAMAHARLLELFEIVEEVPPLTAAAGGH